MSSLNPRKIVLGCSVLLGLSAMITGCSRPGTPSPAAGYDGAFICSHVSSDSIFNLFKIDSAFDALALFTNTPGGTVPVFVDSVTINNLPMEIDGDSVGYIATDFQGNLNFSAGAQWKVYGANGIPSFTYNDQTPYPKYLTLPDTISPAAGYTFPINATVAPGVDSLVVEIEAGTTAAIKGANSTSSGLNFTPAELSALVPGDSTLMVLHAFSLNPQTISGKNFAFMKTRVYYKQLIIK